MVKTETDEIPKKKEDVVELTEVVTQTAPAFKLPNGDVVGFEDYIVWLGNMVYHIKKNTG